MISLVRPPCDEAALRSAPETPGCASYAKQWVLIASILGSSIAFLEASVINVSLPAIQHGLDASVVEMQWIGTAYTLILAAFTLVGGAIGDRFGRRPPFAVGTLILALGSIVCAIAVTPLQLIAGRAIQGFGAALLVPNSLALLSASFPRAERGRAIGTWSAATALTGAVSPIVGGWLVDTVSWRGGFLAVLPFALATLAVERLRVPEPPRRREGPHVDWLGAALATAGLGGLVFAIIASGARGMSPLHVGLGLVVGATALVAFAGHEAHSASPMVPPTLFRSPTFRGVNFLTLALYFGVTAAFFVLPFNLVQVQGYSAALTGAAFLPFALILGGLSRWVGELGDRIGAKPLLVVGPFVTAVGLALLAVPRVGGSYWVTFFPPIAIVGLGMALTVTPLTATVMSSVEPAQVGIASAVNNTAARVGGLLAVAAIGLVIVPVFGKALAGRLEATQIDPSIRQAFIIEATAFTDVKLPASVREADRTAIERAVREASVDSFRWVVLLSAVFALGGALGAARMIETSPAEVSSPSADTMVACEHLDQIRDVAPRTRGCGQCVESGDAWVHLRMCLTCGAVGCCDSSKNRHATAHFWSTQHAIARSIEAGEDWRWCYVDEVVV